MTPKAALNTSDEPGRKKKGKVVPTIPKQDTDGRDLWKPASRWDQKYRDKQWNEGLYIFALLAGSITLIGCVTLGLVEWVFLKVHGEAAPPHLRGCLLLAASGLLGGTVYGAKWLYHGVARGLWHEDRLLWRLLAPWISLGVTVGVGACLHAGFFTKATAAGAAAVSSSSLVGSGFMIGYFSDKALAKMREVMEVLFGETKSGVVSATRPTGPSDKE